MINRLGSRPPGMQLVEITPIMLGGDPANPANKAWVTRQRHFEMVRYWNRVIAELREQPR